MVTETPESRAILEVFRARPSEATEQPEWRVLRAVRIMMPLVLLVLVVVVGRLARCLCIPHCMDHFASYSPQRPTGSKHLLDRLFITSMLLRAVVVVVAQEAAMVKVLTRLAVAVVVAVLEVMRA
jgi:hypothetical protein